MGITKHISIIALGVFTKLCLIKVKNPKIKCILRFLIYDLRNLQTLLRSDAINITKCLCKSEV